MEKSLYANTTWEPTKACRLKFRKEKVDLFRVSGDCLAMPRYPEKAGAIDCSKSARTGEERNGSNCSRKCLI
jgi:hypothetical protein